MPNAVAVPPPQKRDPGAGRLRPCRARSLDEVDAWEPLWRELDHSVHCPLAHFSWTRSFVRAFSADVNPWLAAVMREGRCVALAPLVRERLHAVRRLFLAGVSQLHEPMDLAWSDQPALERLLVSLARGGSPLVFERMFADSPTVSKLRQVYWPRAIVIVHPQPGCPRIALDESWLEPETHLSAQNREELRRARHEAERLGPVTTEIHVPDLDQLAGLLDTAFEVEARGWTAARTTALLQDPHRSAFYRQYAEAACMEGSLRISFLRIGDRVAAMQLAVELPEGFWLLRVGSDARFGHCSPAMLLTREMIRYAAEAGLATYEFLGKIDGGTRVWTSQERPCISVRVYPFGLRGLSALAADLVVATARRWRREATHGAAPYRR